MATHHALPGELIDIRPLQGKVEGALSKALYKSKSLEVFRLFLVAGKVIPEHRVPGEITVQCLEGCVEFTAAGSRLLMRQGDLICLMGSEPHSLKGVEDGSVLVTLLLDRS